jgi:hypothetical protein
MISTEELSMFLRKTVITNTLIATVLILLTNTSAKETLLIQSGIQMKEPNSITTMFKMSTTPITMPSE